MTLLDLTIFLPLIGFLVLILMPKGNDETIRRVALGIAVVVFLISLGMIGPVLASPKDFQYVQNTPWIEVMKINYHVGVDGLSLRGW